MERGASPSPLGGGHPMAMGFPSHSPAVSIARKNRRHRESREQKNSNQETQATAEHLAARGGRAAEGLGRDPDCARNGKTQWPVRRLDRGQPGGDFGI